MAVMMEAAMVAVMLVAIPGAMAAVVVVMGAATAVVEAMVAVAAMGAAGKSAAVASMPMAVPFNICQPAKS